MNVLSELDRVNVAYEFHHGDEVVLLCPFHKDTSASCYVNFKKKVFSCKACGAGGDLVKLICGITKQDRHTVATDINKRYGISTDKTIKVETVEKYHRQLFNSPELLSELSKRQVDERLIRKYRLGEREGRITIPVKNAQGQFVNIRRYLPGAPGSSKMRNAKGRGKMRWFPIEQLDYQTILVTGGEMKAIVAADKLNSHGIGGICLTGGEGNIDTELIQALINKDVVICMDVDEAGAKARDIWCRLCSRIAATVKHFDLPLDIKGGDINDFHGDLLYLVKKAKTFVFQHKPKFDPDEPSEEVSLQLATSGEYTGKRVKVKGLISAVHKEPFVIPKTVQPQCTRDQEGCSICPLYLDDKPQVISPESPEILSLVGGHKGDLSLAIRETLSVPVCKAVEFEPIEYYTVEDARVSPDMSLDNMHYDRDMQPAVIIGGELELNETYDMVGRMHPNPKSQAATLVISAAKPADDALSTYEPTLDYDKFRPEAWTVEAIQKKLDHIYEDLACNVTGIYDRPKMHLTYDLAYHSPLFFEFEKKIVKGWVEVLVLGDSAQGKSEAVVSMQKFYKLGKLIDCKNATSAGLLGGLMSSANRWFVAWGEVPSNDRRLVIYEEAKGLAVETISKLTDMRSSGIAQLPKIEKRQTHARTRGIWNSNPRPNRSMATYSQPIIAVPELIGSPEDVRRFDLACIVSSSDVDTETISTVRKHEHVYTSEECRNLVLWGWTLSDVTFEDQDYIRTKAVELTKIYTDRIPLVDKGSMRLKLARLAAALAVRTFSNKGSGLLVRNCHVDYMCMFLNQVYERAGYLEYSEAIKLTENMKDPNKVKNAIETSPFPKDLVESLLAANSFGMQDIMDWCDWDRQTSQAMISLFVRKRAIRRSGRGYFKNPSFIELLRDLLNTIEDRPNHVPEF